MNNFLKNYLKYLPYEIMFLILSDNELWRALECAYPAFARYCRINKKSYYNQTLVKKIFPEHAEEEDPDYWGRNNPGRLRFPRSTFIPLKKCECFYCYLRDIPSGGYCLKNNKYISNTNYLSNNIVYQNKCEVWFSDDKIHRDHLPAIISDGYKCYVRMNKKHRIGYPAEINGSEETYYENNKIVNTISIDRTEEELYDYRMSIFYDKDDDNHSIIYIDSCSWRYST